VTVLAVLLGGILGTALRLGIDTAIPHADNEFPVSTLIINVVGSFVLAVLVSRVWDRASPWIRAGLGTGLLGSFTTFSAVAVSIVSLAVDDQLGLALGYLAVSVILGLGAAWLGLRLGGPRRSIRGAVE
jgi:CrcB protein